MRIDWPRRSGYMRDLVEDHVAAHLVEYLTTHQAIIHIAQAQTPVRRHLDDLRPPMEELAGGTEPLRVSGWLEHQPWQSRFRDGISLIATAQGVLLALEIERNARMRGLLTDGGTDVDRSVAAGRWGFDERKMPAASAIARRYAPIFIETAASRPDWAARLEEAVARKKQEVPA